MRQDKLFYESALQAVEIAIAESAFTYKQVASHLWPAKKPDTAYARLKACLNDDKDEKFSFEEIIEICKHIDRYDPLYFFADECSHSRGEPCAPEDEAANLQREFIASAKRMENIAARIEKLRKL